MKKALAAFALTLCFMSAFAQSENVALLYGNKTWTDAEEQVVEQQVRFWDLMVMGDTKSLQSFFYPNVIFVGGEGYTTAEHVINALNSGKTEYKKVNIYNMEIRFCGREAMVYTTLSVLSKEDGKRVVTPLYVTSLFIQNKGEWQLGSMTTVVRTTGQDSDKISIVRN